MPSGEDKQPKQYEVTDANAMGIAIVGVGLSAMALGAFIFGFFVLNWYGGRDPATSYRASDLTLQHDPWTADLHLQDAPGVVLDEFIRDEAAKIEGWDVVSEDPKIYRIPIETAMDIVAEQGHLPDFKKLGLSPGSATTNHSEND